MGIIETLQAEIQSLKERVTALEQQAKGSDRH
jgi:cell division protein FtsB